MSIVDEEHHILLSTNGPHGITERLAHIPGERRLGPSPWESLRPLIAVGRQCSHGPGVGAGGTRRVGQPASGQLDDPTPWRSEIGGHGSGRDGYGPIQPCPGKKFLGQPAPTDAGIALDEHQARRAVTATGKPCFGEPLQLRTPPHQRCTARFRTDPLACTLWPLPLALFADSIGKLQSHAVRLRIECGQPLCEGLELRQSTSPIAGDGHARHHDLNRSVRTGLRSQGLVGHIDGLGYFAGMHQFIRGGHTDSQRRMPPGHSLAGEPVIEVHGAGHAETLQKFTPDQSGRCLPRALGPQIL